MTIQLLKQLTNPVLSPLVVLQRLLGALYTLGVVHGFSQTDVVHAVQERVIAFLHLRRFARGPAGVVLVAAKVEFVFRDQPAEMGGATAVGFAAEEAARVSRVGA